MFHFIYLIGSFAARTSLVIIGLFHPKIRKFNHFRSKAKAVPASKRKYWIHCASLGEYEMVVPLIQRLTRSHGLENVLITFFSPSGYNHASVHSPFKECMMFLPLDSAKAARKFYRDYQIKKAIMVRYDLWYHFLREGLSRNIAFYLVNARLHANHKLLGWGGKPYQKLLKQFSRVYCSDQDTVKHLKGLGIHQVEFSGDSRFDRVYERCNEAPTYPAIATFKGDERLLVLGSSWPEEEDLLLANSAWMDQVKVIIAPHDVGSARVAQLMKKFNEYDPVKWSDGPPRPDARLLILDTMGMLASVYRYADVALVGGGFKGALHNILEPAVWGCTLFYGYKTEKYPEAHWFQEAGFGHSISNAEEWKMHWEQLTDERLELNAKKAVDFVEMNLGATEKIFQELV